ncbi:probable tubulin polyglutamylase ttll-15 isoform X1 [Haliotis asinina]|uniref:probable tubulin polyglutamylase ttll-15 isoform X1 n=2 Tax=Haliotis asinina TaxID=109174 RepID=UPI003531EF68
MDHQYHRMKYPGMDDYGHRHRIRTPSKLIYIVGVILFLGIILTVLNIYELHKMKEDHSILHSGLIVPEGRDGKSVYKQPVVWVAAKRIETGYLKHVFNVFERVGYVTGSQESDWDVLWSHDYPFIAFAKSLSNLKPHQRVNHFPGSGYITNKASLASTKMQFIPRAFKVPYDKDKFRAYAKDHPGTKWVQKSNNHRGIEIKDIKDLDLTQEGTFVQEYVAKPFLVDGRKFDIGVYTILTSIDPLRLYIVEGDALFRFCVKDYYPFDYHVLEKYVVKDDYTPMWKLPSLKKMYEDMNYSFINTFNAYLQKKGLNYKKVWDDIRSAILTVYKDKEAKLVEASNKYKSTRNFFEMVRFDFVLDEDLNVYLMEANMSPNLSSLHFAQNKRLYEHVIFNLLGLVGLIHPTANNFYSSSDDELAMQVSDKDISVFPDVCSSSRCHNHCNNLECKLCSECLTTEWHLQLKLAYLEHVRRGSCRRLFPEPMNQTEAQLWKPGKEPASFSKLTDKNKLISLWFMGKCQMDSAFCR